MLQLQPAWTLKVQVPKQDLPSTGLPGGDPPSCLSHYKPILSGAREARHTESEVELTRSIQVKWVWGLSSEGLIIVVAVERPAQSWVAILQNCYNLYYYWK